MDDKRISRSLFFDVHLPAIISISSRINMDMAWFFVWLKKLNNVDSLTPSSTCTFSIVSDQMGDYMYLSGRYQGHSVCSMVDWNALCFINTSRSGIMQLKSQTFTSNGLCHDGFACAWFSVQYQSLGALDVRHLGEGHFLDDVLNQWLTSANVRCYLNRPMIHESKLQVLHCC